ncbi:hypothetical protein [Lentibacillus sp. CBA3610]|uniref:hypothetical protein n=1 Tax=Lentibacillus sp. CBA3610 TaxID=2518176 RepID=UPI0015959B03|nr:hypothetical protein [Lentibacillus sp. CBA3610]QKY70585.1 hypothetical protein Len3610_14185 [Lentibacillus sp. CBA3610]
MTKTTSPTFVLTLELDYNTRMFAAITDELEICRVIYNTVLGEYLKREKQMKREKTYKRLIRQLHGVNKKLAKDDHDASLIDEKKMINQKLHLLRKKYGLTEFASHTWVKPIRKHFHNKVNAAVAQKIASRAWLTFSKKLLGKAKHVRFVRKGDMESFEGKTNTTGWRFIDGFLVYKDLTTPLRIRKHDAYASEVLHHLDQQTPFSYTIISDGKEKTVQDRYGKICSDCSKRNKRVHTLFC